jgi:Ni/Co efflux regulator RcnB
MQLLTLQDLPPPTGSDQYAIAAIVLVAVAALRFAEALFCRYMPPKTTDNNDEDQADRDRVVLHKMAEQTHELREWHKPDHNGNQTWKNGQTISILRDIRDAIVRQEENDLRRERDAVERERRGRD